MSTTSSKKERRKSWKDRNTADNGAPEDGWSLFLRIFLNQIIWFWNKFSKPFRRRFSLFSVSQADDASEILSVSSYLSATSKGLSSIKSYESVNDTKRLEHLKFEENWSVFSMVTAVSGSIEEEQRAMTPTEEDVSFFFYLLLILRLLFYFFPLSFFPF